MKIKYLTLFLLCTLIFNLGITSANTPEKISYSIVKDSILIEMEFNDVENLELTIPYDAKTIEVNTQNYEIKEIENAKQIIIPSESELKIKYITKTLVDKSRDEYFFVVKNQFENETDVTLYLPESAILSEPKIIFPEAKITTDGRNIILQWDKFADEQILVSYTFVKDNNYLFYITILLLLILTAILVKFQQKRHKKELEKIKEKIKKKSETKEERITQNLFEDEKRIVEYLLEKKGERWTKEIMKDLEISKVKLSRKLRSLEAKEIIKKIPYGNENKIRLLK